MCCECIQNPAQKDWLKKQTFVPRPQGKAALVLPAMDKALATQELVFEKSTDAQTAYAEGGNKLLRAQNNLKATFKDLRDRVVTALIPAFMRLVEIGGQVGVRGETRVVHPSLGFGREHVAQAGRRRRWDDGIKARPNEDRARRQERRGRERADAGRAGWEDALEPDLRRIPVVRLGPAHHESPRWEISGPDDIATRMLCFDVRVIPGLPEGKGDE